MIILRADFLIKVKINEIVCKIYVLWNYTLPKAY